MSAKRLKARPIESESEFRALVNQIAKLESEHLAIAARRDRAVQRINARYAVKLAPLDDEIDAMLARADAYAELHRTQLLPKDKKSVDLACATFGWRTGNRTVKITPKTISEEDVISALKIAGLGAYVRTCEEIAKDKILADCKDDLTLAAANPATPGEDKSQPVPLAQVHLKITQSETFYIEPKVETAETINPAEAAAS